MHHVYLLTAFSDERRSLVPLEQRIKNIGMFRHINLTDCNDLVAVQLR